MREGKRQSLIRGEREREKEGERKKEGEFGLRCLQTPRGSEQIESDGLLISQLTAPKTGVGIHAHTDTHSCSADHLNEP